MKREICHEWAMKQSKKWLIHPKQNVFGQESLKHQLCCSIQNIKVKRQVRTKRQELNCLQVIRSVLAFS